MQQIDGDEKETQPYLRAVRIGSKESPKVWCLVGDKRRLNALKCDVFSDVFRAFSCQLTY